MATAKRSVSEWVPTKNCVPLQKQVRANWSRESVLEQLARPENLVQARSLPAQSQWVWQLAFVRVSALARDVEQGSVWERWHD